MSRRRIRLRFLLIPLLAGAAYYAIFGGEYGLLELRRLKRERAAEAERVNSAEAEVVRLRARADSLAREPAALERLARERYGLIKEGERLYRFVDSARTSATPPAQKAASDSAQHAAPRN